ncbi:hypothetical protein ACHAXA_006641 [Cyclostephanos tholiformis]|uniref:Transmembrane protein n=1 Tax=Cyclostephanos tholiformis TaxID=382380 RepID=A0ABD3R5G1_9STRA
MALKHFSLPLATAFVVQLLIGALLHAPSISAFAPVAPFNSPHVRSSSCHRHQKSPTTLASSLKDNRGAGVIDLTDDDDDVPSSMAQAQSDDNIRAAAPFLSQGELSDDPNLLSPDFSDGKQSRVIIYIILTLVPILFLVPLMIGSRDLIPLDALPPVELN